MMIYIAVILLFSLLVIIHEWGHFMAARRGGVTVEEFGVGFPPKVWGKVRRGVLYSINLLPLGGFVRLKGEDGDDTSKGSFGAAKTWTKTKILLAGVVMNLITAVVLFYGLAVTGMPGLGSLEPGFLAHTYSQAPKLVVADVAKDSPAAQAGIKNGEYIVSANDKAMATNDDLRTFTKDNAGQTVKLIIEKGGEGTREVMVKLRDPGSTQGYLGVVGQQDYKLKYDPITAVAAAVWVTGALFFATIVGVFKLLVGIPVLVIGLFSSSVPAAAAEAAGPLGILFIFKSISTLGISYVTLLLANIAVALAAFNVLPLPALDGGRLALIWWQRLTGRKISADTEAQIHGIGFMVLLGLMALITVYDFRKFF